MKMAGMPELCDVEPHNDFDYKATNKKLLKFSCHCIEINFLIVSNERLSLKQRQKAETFFVQLPSCAVFQDEKTLKLLNNLAVIIS